MPKTTFVDGNPALGQLGTLVTAEFLNKIFAHRHDGQDADGSAPINYALDTGAAANTYELTMSPPLSAYTEGMLIRFRAGHTNTGASTLNASGIGAKPIYGLAHVALQGGEILAGGDVWVAYNAALNTGSGAWVLLCAGGGSLQVKNATSDRHAVSRVVGDAVYEQIAPGKIGYFARKTLPVGWLAADGAAISIATYSTLAAVIYCADELNATALFGYRCTDPANPSTTRSTAGTYIVLPDLRGEFLRGWDNGRGVDSGRYFGSAQKGSLAVVDASSSRGVVCMYNTADGQAAATAVGLDDYLTSDFANSGIGNATWGTSVALKGTAEVASGTTRPRNISLFACIKY